MKKFLAILTIASAMMIGPCKLNSWNIALGPKPSMTGINLDFSNGVDFVVPLFR